MNLKCLLGLHHFKSYRAYQTEVYDLMVSICTRCGKEKYASVGHWVYGDTKRKISKDWFELFGGNDSEIIQSIRKLEWLEKLK